MKKENSSFMKGNIQMDNISRKRKIKDTDGKSEVKKVRLTRSPSFGKRVTLYSEGEVITSKECEKPFVGDHAHKIIMTYHAEESIAENIQKHKLYEIIPNVTKDFH